MEPWCCILRPPTDLLLSVKWLVLEAGSSVTPLDSLEASSVTAAAAQHQAAPGQPVRDAQSNRMVGCDRVHGAGGRSLGYGIVLPVHA